MTNPLPGSGEFVGANIWNIDWQGQQHIFKPGTDFATASDPWHEGLVAELYPYKVLRFTDWNDTNFRDSVQAHFATRKPKTGMQDQPVAMEWQIDLCNRADTDCWLNVHSASTAEDWRQVAGLFRTGLKPSLRLYVEWSNEVWNSVYPQHQFAIQEAQRLQLPGKDAAAAYYVYASVRMFTEFEKAFATQPHRLIKVLAGHAAATGTCEAEVQALGDPRINPQHVRPDVYAISPYLFGYSIPELRDALREVAEWTTQQRRCADRMGVPMISYEGGSDSFALGVAECTVFQHLPEMRGLYRDYLATLFSSGLRGPFMQYTHSGACWGLKENTGDPDAQSPKYQGVLDYLQEMGRR